jgi:hypothetical protein
LDITIKFRDVEVLNVKFNELPIDKLKDYAGIKGVYLLLNDDDEIVYVGISKNIGNRVFKHFQGTTHTAYFSSEFSRALYLEVNDDVERETIEKLLINQFRPPYNDVPKGKRNVCDEVIIAIKYLISKGVPNVEIANEFNVSTCYVSSIKTGRYYADINIPPGYVYDKQEVMRKQNEFEKIEQSRKGFIPKGPRRTEFTEDQIKTVFKLRFIEGLTYREITEKTGIPHHHLLQIVFRKQKRYEKMYETFMRECS